MLKDKGMHRLSKISIYFAVCIALFSARPWFVWDNRIIELVVIFFFIVCRLIIMRPTISKKNASPAIFALFLLGYMYVINAPDVSKAFTQTCTKVVPLVLFIQLTSSEKRLFIRSFTWIFSIILLISLLFFTLFQIGVPLPYSRISHFDAHYSEFYNYYAFIIDGHLGIFTRFRSVFTEPGHVGMFVALLMYVNNYKLLKWQRVVFLISIIWSFSLAAYILLCLGYILHLVLSRRLSKYVLFLPLGLLIAFLFVKLYYNNNKDSLISELIISRLQMTEDGNIAGNNRHTGEFTRYYENFANSPRYITGLGCDVSQLTFLSGNASYKNFILENGIIGIVLLIGLGLSILSSFSCPCFLCKFACSYFFHRAHDSDINALIVFFL